MLKSIGIPELLILTILIFGTGVIPAIAKNRISKRLGWSPWLGLVTMVPFGTLFWSYFVGFSEWPTRRTERAER